MSTAKTLVIESTSSDATEQLAEQLARRLRGSEVIALISDLGGGKTTLTRGLARGIDSPDRVASPTFTISKVYAGKTLTIHHFDFYRLNDAGVVAHELHDVIDGPQNVVVVEWGEIVEDVLPDERLTIMLERSGEESRTLTLTYPSSLSYLVEGL